MSSSDDDINNEGGISSEDGASTTEALRFGKSSRVGDSSTKRGKKETKFKSQLTRELRFAKDRNQLGWHLLSTNKCQLI